MATTTIIKVWSAVRGHTVALLIGPTRWHKASGRVGEDRAGFWPLLGSLHDPKHIAYLLWASGFPTRRRESFSI
jgi:hypothetical protein